MTEAQPRPVVVNQLGPSVAQSLAAHPARPLVLPDRDGALWNLPAEANILVTGPLDGWRDAPDAAPLGWPFGLRWVQLSSAGVDFYPDWLLDVPTLTLGRGIGSDAIAEYVLLAMLRFEKRLERMVLHGLDDWPNGPADHRAGTLQGRTLGIAGFGSIGRAVAVRAASFGMRVLACRHSPWDPAAPGAEGIIPVATLATLAQQADHLVLALPLTAQTRHCIDRTVLAGVRGLHLVNIARGGLIDQDALLAALDDGAVAAASLDVTEPEPLPAGHPFYTHPNVTLTPHVSGAGADAQNRFRDRLARNLSLYADGLPLEERYDRRRRY